MANIIVTGGCGFIGSNLVDMLVQNPNDNVIVVDNLFTGKRENCNIKAKYIFDDIRNVFAKNYTNPSLQNINVIFHLAALPRIQPSFENPNETLDINTKGTALVCEFARKNNIKIVYAGSSSFYGGVYLNPYAFSKWQGEEVCKLYSEVYGLSTVIARFFNVYGQRHVRTGPYATVVGIFEKQMLANESLTITGNGKQRRDFTNVKDICRALIEMSKDIWKGDIFNLGSGRNYSINDVAFMFKQDIKYIARRPGEAWITLADIFKTKKLLNWTPKVNLQDWVLKWLEKKHERRTNMTELQHTNLSKQALGAIMMALQKSLLEQSDIVPVLEGFKMVNTPEGLVVLNPPLVKFNEETNHNFDVVSADESKINPFEKRAD